MTRVFLILVALQNAAKEASSSLELSKQQESALSTRLRALEAEQSQLNARTHTLQSQNDALTTQLAAAEGRVQSLRASLQAEESEKSAALTRLQEAETRADSLQRKLDENALERKREREQHTRDEQERRASADRELLQTQDQLRALDDALRDARAETATLLQQLEALQSRAENAVKQHRETERELSTRLTARQEELGREIAERVSARHGSCLIDCLGLQEAAQDALAELQQRHSQLEAAHADEERARLRDERDLKHARDQLATERQRVVDLEASVERLTRKIEARSAPMLRRLLKCFELQEERLQSERLQAASEQGVAALSQVRCQCVRTATNSGRVAGASRECAAGRQEQDAAA